MTDPRDTVQRLDAYVVVFDICSSTSMLDDLILNGKEEAMRNLLIGMKEFLTRHEDEPRHTAYKFIGDGWILVFPSETNGIDLVLFLEELSHHYLECFQSWLQPVLSRSHKPNGLTFGVHRGPLVSFEMMEQNEYVGRPLNVASRLQGVSKTPFKVLLSNTAYSDLRIPPGFRPVEKQSIPLRSIQGGEAQDCFLLTLEMGQAGVPVESKSKPGLSRHLPLHTRSRNKAWYYWKNNKGEGFLLAFVNARGSCSIRTFEAERGSLLNRSYKSGDYQDNFSDLIKDGIELAVSAQPNLDRDCKEKLPYELLTELKGQFQE